MSIGLGIVLIVIGAVLIWALDVDISFIEDYTLGWILLIAGSSPCFCPCCSTRSAADDLGRRHTSRSAATTTPSRSRKLQRLSSATSIASRSVASAIARSAVTLGNTWRAKNCAAATLPA